jgi:hypothetical protein
MQKRRSSAPSTGPVPYKEEREKLIQNIFTGCLDTGKVVITSS